MGEAGGAAFFESLQTHLVDPDQRRQSYALQLLEEQTRERVADELRAMNVELPDAAAFVRQAAIDAHEAGERPWIEMIKTTLDIEPDSIVAYQKLEGLLSEPGIALVLLEHGRALIEFCERELQGDPRALDSVLAVLTSESRARLAERTFGG